MDIEYDRDYSTLIIQQNQYIDDVVLRCHQQNVKDLGNPCKAGLRLSKIQLTKTKDERAEVQLNPYKS